MTSNQTALEATEAGFEVGTRTTVDVLDARRRLFEAQRDYARSRYDYLINLVRLKSAAGVLAPQDLSSINDVPDAPHAAAGHAARRAEQRHDHRDEAVHRAAALRHRLQAALAVGPRGLRVVEPVVDALREIVLTAHDAQRAASAAAARRRPRVLRVRPRQHRQPEHRGLEQVVAADRHQAAADERDVGGRVEDLQLAERIDEVHRVAGARTARQHCAARTRDRGARNSARTDVEALRVARHQDQQRVPVAFDGRARARRAPPPPRLRACCPRSTPAARSPA